MVRRVTAPSAELAGAGGQPHVGGEAAASGGPHALLLSPLLEGRH